MKPLFENENYAVFEKPWGISTHSADEGDLGFSEWLQLHCNLRLFVVSRLDKETSGPIIFAKTKLASAEAERIHLSQDALKTYNFLSVPKETVASAAWHNSDSLDGKPALTQFRVLEKFAHGVMLIEAKIRSGRRHQIRRHAASSGVPIIGDLDYGGASFPRVMLHCMDLNWPGLEVTIQSKLPKAFAALLAQLSTKRFKTACIDLEVLTHLALDRRGSLFNESTNAYRVIHRGECLKDFSMDRFANQFCVWVYDTSSMPQAEAAARIVAKELGLSSGVIKTMFKNPHHNEGLCHNVAMNLETPSAAQASQIKEHNLQYSVNLNANEQTGFFIDQRDNRRRVFLFSPGRNVANLFSYTCSFSIVAAAGGAKSVVSVDVSKSALREGLENFRANQLEDKSKLKFIPDDVRPWLDRQIRKSRLEAWEPFDLIICDPPTFGKSAGKSAFRIEKEWADLAYKIAQIIEPKNGLVLFCTNNRSLDTKLLQETLQKFFGKVVRYRTPLDFPEAVDPRHNRFFWCSEPISQNQTAKGES